MGRELSKTYLVYAESLLRADKILKRYGCEWSLLGMCSSMISFSGLTFF